MKIANSDKPVVFYSLDAYDHQNLEIRDTIS